MEDKHKRNVRNQFFIRRGCNGARAIMCENGLIALFPKHLLTIQEVNKIT